jgi:adenylate cyclase
LKTSEKLFDITFLKVTKNSENFLKPAIISTKLNKEIIENKILDFSELNNYKTDEILKIEDYLLSQLVSENNLYWNYFGTKDGIFIGAEKINNQKIRIHYSNNPELKIDCYYKIVDYEKNIIDIIKNPPSSVGYDPRVRSWYKDALNNESFTWTDMYVFKLEETVIGMTVTTKIKDENGNIIGVSANDIVLTKISEYIKNLSVSKNGYAFIIDEKNQIIAFPDEFKNLTVEDENGLRTKFIHELNKKYLTNAINKIENNKIIRIKNSKNENLITSLRSFPKEFQNNWKIMIIIPEDDLIGDLKKSNLYTLYTTLIILFLSFILISIISKKIAIPIKTLTNEALAIQNLNINKNIKIATPIKELQNLSNSIDNLKNAVISFKRYVPENLVKTLIKNEEKIQIGGKEKNLTLFFSDIADFTTISEKLPPEYLTLHLSEYLDEMTKIILENNGIIDKYIGDAIVAVFGAFDDKNHEKNGVISAYLCQKKLEQLNEKWKNENKATLYTRIGINTSNSTIGFIGSNSRVNYSVLGTSLEITERLESLNKTYNSNIIISENTFLKSKKDFIFIALDTLNFKNQNFIIYETIDNFENFKNSDSYFLFDLINEYNSYFYLLKKKNIDEFKSKINSFNKSIDKHKNLLIVQKILKNSEFLNKKYNSYNNSSSNFSIEQRKI